MQVLTLARPAGPLRGRIALAGSKSISNRVLIIRALSGRHFPIHHLANARDTELLQQLLAERGSVWDAGAAGTTFRFLTAYLSTQPGEQVLTGSERMKQRPIGVLVDALRSLGAQIDYLEQAGYPPLKIGAPTHWGRTAHLHIGAHTSSQYITALLLLAPTLPQGLSLTLEGEVVSRPYIDMTLQLMAHFGVSHHWDGATITVAHQAYEAREFRVEADWSAASYYYSLAALSPTEVDLQLDGLFAHSSQGDAVLTEQYRQFGVVSTFNDTGVRLQKPAGVAPPAVFEWDFLACPDLAQTLAVTCAGLGVTGLYTGLETLRIKETDRIAALKTELAKVGVSLAALPPRFSKRQPNRAFFMQEGRAAWEAPPTFATYEDHRMAMALAPLALVAPVRVAEPEVVAKSYPAFWDDLASLGFTIATGGDSPQ